MINVFAIISVILFTISFVLVMFGDLQNTGTVRLIIFLVSASISFAVTTGLLIYIS